MINVHIYTGEDLYWVDDFTIHIETLGIGDDNVPAFYSLGEAYPNPFNPETRIKYGLIQDGYASLMVHDLMGRKVKTLVSSERMPGFTPFAGMPLMILVNPYQQGCTSTPSRQGSFETQKK